MQARDRPFYYLNQVARLTLTKIVTCGFQDLVFYLF